MSAIDGGRLVALLADGRLRSQVHLASRLGSSVDAVNSRLRSLEDLGLRVDHISGRGVRLSRPIFLMDELRIRRHLGAGANARLESLTLQCITASTSDALIKAGPPAPGCARVSLAEFQTGGRARRGRRWIAPYGASVCMSLAWNFASMPRDPGNLSLATGVVVCETLSRLGLPGLAVKWPNDIVVGTAKLGGILIDAQAGQSGRFAVVIGIGLNHSLPTDAPRDIAALGGDATDMTTLMPAGAPGRNLVAAELIKALLRMLDSYAQQGFAPFRDAWCAADCLRDLPVTVLLSGRQLAGIARGVADDGALKVETPDGFEQFHSGEVSVRRVSDAAR